LKKNPAAFYRFSLRSTLHRILYNNCRNSTETEICTKLQDKEIVPFIVGYALSRMLQQR